MTSDIGDRRREFWEFCGRSDPSAGFPAWRDKLVWLPMTRDGEVVLTLSISQDRSSVFLRACWGEAVDTARPFCERHHDALAKGLRVLEGHDSETEQGRWFRKNNPASFTLRSKWPEIARWFGVQRRLYLETIARIEAP